jgi:hypothetical protein
MGMLLNDAIHCYLGLLPVEICWKIYLLKISSCVSADDFNVDSHRSSPIWTQDNKYVILSYTPYEDLLNNKIENDIEEPSSNAQEKIILTTDDEKPQEHWQQEELVE